MARGYTPISTTAQDLTTSWADFGSEVEVWNHRSMGLWCNNDINNGANIRVRVLAKGVSGGTDEFILPIKIVGTTETKLSLGYYEFDSDADQKVLLEITLANLVPYVQVQVQAGTAGAPTAAQMDFIYYTLGN